jgi:hypothetical protein
VYISERDWRPESLIRYWPPEVATAVWSLWHVLEEGPVIAIEHGRPIPPSRWSADRLMRLAPGEQTALGPFIKEIQRSVAHVRILAAELMKFFSESAKPLGADDNKPLSPQANKPPPTIDNKPPPKLSRGKGLTAVWQKTIEPQIELAIQKRGGPYATLEDAVDAVLALPGFTKRKLLGRKAVRDGIRKHFRKWFVSEGKKDV